MQQVRKHNKWQTFLIGSMQLHAHSTFFTITDVDYDPSTPFVVIFSMGSAGSIEFATILAQNDSNVEGDHDFTVSIESTSLPVTLGTSSTTATIIDDDRKFDLWWKYITLFTGIHVVSIYS